LAAAIQLVSGEATGTLDSEVVTRRVSISTGVGKLQVEIGFPDDFPGSQLMLAIGAQSKLNGLHHMMETP
jgi:hypothetical protein